MANENYVIFIFILHQKLHKCIGKCKCKYRNALPFYILHPKLNNTTHMLLFFLNALTLTVKTLTIAF